MTVSSSHAAEPSGPIRFWLVELFPVWFQALKATGLRSGDPRLKECMEMLKESLKKTPDGVTLDRHLFKK